MNEKAIEVRDLTFRYRSGDFSLRLPLFSVDESETVAVIGPSGTGKTTLLNLLAGCCSPDAGSVCIKGTDIVGMSERARREFRIRSIGMIFQEFELLDHLSVLDNIVLPYRITPGLDYNRSVCERAARLANEVGMGIRLKRNVRQLSQGERQRVAMCRALVTEPTVLLCDEPTGNLDPANSKLVMDIMFTYVESHGATLVAVTHDHDSASRFVRTVDIACVAGGSEA
jgi:putative ABC transport system ATP-binding protein